MPTIDGKTLRHYPVDHAEVREAACEAIDKILNELWASEPGSVGWVLGVQAPEVIQHTHEDGSQCKDNDHLALSNLSPAGAITALEDTLADVRKMAERQADPDPGDDEYADVRDELIGKLTETLGISADQISEVAPGILAVNVDAVNLPEILKSFETLGEAEDGNPETSSEAEAGKSDDPFDLI